MITAHGMRRTHLGSRNEDTEGVVAWSRATTAKTLELITAKTTDAVTSVAQTLGDADAAHEMESTAIQAMHLAAAS